MSPVPLSSFRNQLELEFEPKNQPIRQVCGCEVTSLVSLFLCPLLSSHSLPCPTQGIRLGDLGVSLSYQIHSKHCPRLWSTFPNYLGRAQGHWHTRSPGQGGSRERAEHLGSHWEWTSSGQGRRQCPAVGVSVALWGERGSDTGPRGFPLVLRPPRSRSHQRQARWV